MTPTAEWYEADEDDSDRSITDDVTASTHETARAATETGETRVHGDADLLRKRTAALDRVAAELAEARAEVERLRMDVSHRSSTTAWQQRRAEAAEAESARLASVVAKVEALAACEVVGCPCGGDRASVPTRDLRAALASVGVSGSADDRREANASQAPDTATPGEAKKRHLHSCFPSDCDHIANRCCIDCCEPGGWAEPAASSVDDKEGE